MPRSSTCGWRRWVSGAQTTFFSTTLDAIIASSGCAARPGIDAVSAVCQARAVVDALYGAMTEAGVRERYVKERPLPFSLSLSLSMFALNSNPLSLFALNSLSLYVCPQLCLPSTLGTLRSVPTPPRTPTSCSTGKNHPFLLCLFLCLSLFALN